MTRTVFGIALWEDEAMCAATATTHRELCLLRVEPQLAAIPQHPAVLPGTLGGGAGAGPL